MIGLLSGFVPWWGAVLIALIAAAGGPTAVVVQNRYKDRIRKSDLRSAAYERLIAASEIAAIRSTILSAQRSTVYSFVQTLSELRKMIAALILGFALTKRPEILRAVTDAIPPPTQIVDSMDVNSLQIAFEELVKASIGVKLYGSGKAIDAAEELLRDARSFHQLIQSSKWTRSGLPEKTILMEARNKMQSSTLAFVAVARIESKLKELKR